MALDTYWRDVECETATRREVVQTRTVTLLEKGAHPRSENRGERGPNQHYIYVPEMVKIGVFSKLDSVKFKK